METDLIDIEEGIQRTVIKKLSKLKEVHGHTLIGNEPLDTYAFSLKRTDDEVEKIFSNEGFVPNPASFLKFNKYTKSDGETVKKYRLYDMVYRPNGILSDYQLHVNMYSAFDDGYIDIYAHWEKSWIRHPIQHLRTKEYSAKKGVKKAKERICTSGIVCRNRNKKDRYNGEK